MSIALVATSLVAVRLRAAEPVFRVQEIADRLGVGYAVSLVDLSDDGRPDVVVVDQERVVWFENPDWPMHVLIENQTRPDNVCIAPYDVDGDGHVDFALGADWRPSDTRTGGTIQWLSRGRSPGDSWHVHPIGEEPTVHRMRWADLDGDGRAELVVVPLMGRGTTRPHFSENGVRILSFPVPADPLAGPWEPEVIDDELHVAHNFVSTDLDRDGRTDLLVVSFEGLNLLERSAEGHWSRTLIGEGNQQTSPERGASEVKHGLLAGDQDYIATIEPWHGFQVVVYTRPDDPADSLWRRRVLDEKLKWGHAVWCAEIDGDGDQELIVGVRDDQDDQHRRGVRIYDPVDAAAGDWRRHLLDPGGVAVEDLAAADLDGDGRTDIVAVGRQTHNVRIYWNEGKSAD